MTEPFSSLLAWWIPIVEIPVLSALFWLLWTIRRDCDDGLKALTDDLARHKLHVARHYASIDNVRELENRLTSHLLRIEAKLDVTSLKAEALKASTSHKQGYYDDRHD